MDADQESASSNLAVSATIGCSRAASIHTYKFVNLAAWAQRPDVQQVFPDIQATIAGVSTANQIVGLQLTDRDWEVPGT